jgi:hypothetical protein
MDQLIQNFAVKAIWVKSDFNLIENIDKLMALLSQIETKNIDSKDFYMLAVQVLKLVESYGKDVSSVLSEMLEKINFIDFLK